MTDQGSLEQRRRRSRLREEIDRIDREIVRLLSRRMTRALEIGRLKDMLGDSMRSPEREESLLGEVSAEAAARGLDPHHAAAVFEVVLQGSRAAQDAELRRQMAAGA